MAAPLSLDQRLKSTPIASEPRVTRSAHAKKDNPQWLDELIAAASAISPPHFDAETLKHRAELQSNVKKAPESPEAWHSYLRLLNDERKRHATPETATYMHDTLVALYDRATSIIPLIRVNRHSEIYLHIWLDLASLRAEDAEDAYLAKETFKYMKRECIGLAFPSFWYSWADLEEQLGNHEKAEEHRRKGRTRESGDVPSTAKPPNPATSRRAFRPPRRANDTPMEENKRSDFATDVKMTDSSEMRTPVTSITTRTARAISSVDRNAHSPALSNWTPVMRENPSPLLKSTPESSLVRPTESSALDGLSKYYAQKRSTPAPESASAPGETKPSEPYSSSRNRKTPNSHHVSSSRNENMLSNSQHSRASPPAERGMMPRERSFPVSSNRQATAKQDPPVRGVFDILGTNSAKRGENVVERTPRSASFQDGSHHRQTDYRSAWNSSSGPNTSQALKPSPSRSSSFSLTGNGDGLSPETLRSVPSRGPQKASPMLFSPSETAAMKESASAEHMNVEKPEEYQSFGRKEEDSAKGHQRHGITSSDTQYGQYGSTVKVEKRERQLPPEADRMDHPRRKPTTPSGPSRTTGTGKSSAMKKEAPDPSPLPSKSPLSQFTGHSDSSSSATPAMERERYRRRMKSPRKPSFLVGLGRDRFVTVNDRQYVILELVGKGGSSRVFKVLNEDMRIMALKRVKVQMTSSYMVTLSSYANEIGLLKKLCGSPNIVQLYDSEVKSELGVISLIMEYGDIDLAQRLNTTDRKASVNGNFRRLYWNQMLEAVHTIHEARIVHGDLKPANFLIVAGTLKLIDFGIAKAIQTEDTTKIVRDTQQGTPNYMSPEALMAEGDDVYDENEDDFSEGKSHKSQYRVGRASDIWSLGCILYQMVYGRTPFAHIKNVLTKLSCIQDPNHEITYRPVDEPLLIDVLKGCLQRDPLKRMSIPELLNHPYLHSGQDQCTNERQSNEMHLQPPRDPRNLVKSVCEAAERSGYCVTTFSGEKIAMRNGDRAYERFLDMVSRKISVPQISNGHLDNGSNQGKDRSLGIKSNLRTPTGSAITNQASRTGLTGTRTKTGTLHGGRTGDRDTKTGDRYWR